MKDSLRWENQNTVPVSFVRIWGVKNQDAKTDNRLHFILQCSAFKKIRDDFLCQFVSMNPGILKYLEASETLLVAMLDPESPMLPQDLVESWTNIRDVYRISRNFAFAMHNRRKSLLEEKLKQKGLEMMTD